MTVTVHVLVFVLTLCVSKWTQTRLWCNVCIYNITVLYQYDIIIIIIIIIFIIIYCYNNYIIIYAVSGIYTL